MVGRIAPHGGLQEPVDCRMPEDEISSFRKEAARLIHVPVSDADVSTVYRFGDGALSPLRGPMDEPTYTHVLDEGVILSQGALYAWTIPLALPVAPGLASKLSPGDRVALVDSRGELVARLDLSDVYPWDKDRYLDRVYLTDRKDHPGADMVLRADGEKTSLIGGEIAVLPEAPNPAFGKFLQSPAEARRRFEAEGWERAVAFQTRNPLHRAHEYALIYGLEWLLRRKFNAIACLNPLLGETKADDVSATVRMQTYEALISSGALGEEDSDPALWRGLGKRVTDRVMLMGLDIKMFYAGPREAVMHAIYRQNYGFTDIIIGRKHADAPYHDGSQIWGDFEAQEIFDHLNGRLLIQPLKVGFAAYYESIGRVDLMENHPDEKPVFISGKQVREMLQRGDSVDSRIMRETTARILSRAMASGE